MSQTTALAWVYVYVYESWYKLKKKNPLIDSKKNKSEFEGLCGFYIVAKTKFLPSHTTHYFSPFNLEC